MAFPRYSESTLRIAEYARERGCPIVAITDSPVSPLGRGAEVVLTAAVDSQAAATMSYAAPLSLTTALITGVALRRKEDVNRRLAHIEAVYSGWERVHPHKGGGQR